MNKVCYALAAALACWCAPLAAQEARDAREAKDATPRDATGPLLIVFHAPAPEDGGAPALRDALAELARARGGALLDLSPAATPAPRAAELWQRGLEAYRAFEYDTALGHLDAAVADAEATGGAELGTEELADLHILRSLVLAQLGDDRRAWQEEVAAATLDPTRTLDPVRFPPRVIESFARAGAALASSGQSQFKVDVEPACQAWLDGNAVAPGEARSVPLGRHYVRVLCPGALPYGARVLVQQPREDFRPALVHPALPEDARLFELARERGARALMVAQVRVSPDAPASVSIRWLDAAAERERERVTSALPDAEAARATAQAAEELLGRERVAAVPEAAPATTHTRRPRAWHQRPWVWVAVGALSTAIALSPLLLDSPSPRGFEVRPGGDLPGGR